MRVRTQIHTPSTRAHALGLLADRACNAPQVPPIGEQATGVPSTIRVAMFAYVVSGLVLFVFALTTTVYYIPTPARTTEETTTLLKPPAPTALTARRRHTQPQPQFAEFM
jgi:hypothetical protein